MLLVHKRVCSSGWCVVSYCSYLCGCVLVLPAARWLLKLGIGLQIWAHRPWPMKATFCGMKEENRCFQRQVVDLQRLVLRSIQDDLGFERWLQNLLEHSRTFQLLVLEIASNHVDVALSLTASRSNAIKFWNSTKCCKRGACFQVTLTRHWNADQRFLGVGPCNHGQDKC